jgi:hypothetical protein
MWSTIFFAFGFLAMVFTYANGGERQGEGSDRGRHLAPKILTENLCARRALTSD